MREPYEYQPSFRKTKPLSRREIRLFDAADNRTRGKVILASASHLADLNAAYVVRGNSFVAKQKACKPAQ
jgi:hypothetical protein